MEIDLIKEKLETCGSCADRVHVVETKELLHAVEQRKEQINRPKFIHVLIDADDIVPYQYFDALDVIYEESDDFTNYCIRPHHYKEIFIFFPNNEKVTFKDFAHPHALTIGLTTLSHNNTVSSFMDHQTFNQQNCTRHLVPLFGYYNIRHGSSSSNLWRNDYQYIEKIYNLSMLFILIISHIHK